MLWDPFLYCINDSIQGNSETGNKVFVLPSKVAINSKDGEVVGVENPDEVMLQTVNSLKDSIAPDVMPFVNVVSRETDGKYVVEINVSVGTNRPYYRKRSETNRCLCEKKEFCTACDG